MDSSINVFLDENKETLEEMLKDKFFKNLEQRQLLSGFYREAYDERLAMRMRAWLMKEIGGQFNLDAEQQLLLESTEMENIIQRSIHE